MENQLLCKFNLILVQIWHLIAVFYIDKHYHVMPNGIFHSDQLWSIFVTVEVEPFVYWIILNGYSQVQIQRGGQGVQTPPGKSQVIWVSIGNKQLDPPPPPGKSWTPPPPGKCWNPSGTLKMIDFFEIDHLNSVK